MENSISSRISWSSSCRKWFLWEGAKVKKDDILVGRADLLQLVDGYSANLHRGYLAATTISSITAFRSTMSSKLKLISQPSSSVMVASIPFF
jgi:hypothetical protein